MEIISSLQQMDAKLVEIDLAASVSDDAARRVFASFRMNFSTALPADPFSADYAECQMQLYRRISGRDYATKNEVSEFNVEAAVLRPFPLNSGSTVTTGMHLSALGFLLSHMKLPPSAAVLEFGPGWGNTTITLAALGYQVTAVDVERNFCDLVTLRANANKVHVNVIEGDFFLCETLGEQFDAVLFYECFHHCADHMRLLRGLHNVVKPGGRVFLGCEPITPDFPLPWGLRMDGESLWAIRRNGWMELGFNASYFRQALARTGWLAKVSLSQDVGFGNVWELERPLQGEVLIPATDPRICSMIGTLERGCRVNDGQHARDYLIYGPYLTLAAGRWLARIHLMPGEARHGQVEMEVCQAGEGSLFAQRSVVLQEYQGDIIELDFTLDEARAGIEVRLLCEENVVVGVSAVGFTPA